MHSSGLKHYDSFAPVVKDEVLRLFEHVRVGGQEAFVPFEKRILWLWESTATVYLRHRGAEVDKLYSWCDRQPLSSIDSAVGEFPAQLEKYRIQPGDVLSLEVALKIERIPVVPDLSPDGLQHNGQWHKKQYLSVPNYWSDGYWYLSDTVADPLHAMPPRLEPVIELEDPCIYTNSRGFVCKPKNRFKRLAKEMLAFVPSRTETFQEVFQGGVVR